MFCFDFLDKSSFPPINPLKICCRINWNYTVVTSSTTNFIPFHNLHKLRPTTQLPDTLHPASLPSCCVLWFLIALQIKMCGGKQWKSLNILRVVKSIYEAAWELVTKCLRNPRKQQFPICSPYFLLRFPMFHIVFPLFLQAFAMFPLVFLSVSYFRSYSSFISIKLLSRCFSRNQDSHCYVISYIYIWKAKWDIENMSPNCLRLNCISTCKLCFNMAVEFYFAEQFLVNFNLRAFRSKKSE